MNEKKDTERPPKRHYVPVLPGARPDSQVNAKRGEARFYANERLASRLDALLGPIESEE